MDDKNIKSVLEDALEAQIPASQINLLPAVEAHLVAGKSSLRQGRNMNRQGTGRLGFLAATLIAVLSLALVTPQGRAFAQNILQFFVRMNSDRLPIQPFQLTPIPQTITPDPGYVFDQSIMEAGQKAGFTVMAPTTLPEILVFAGASYEPDHDIVRIFYSYEGTTNGVVLREERIQTHDKCELCGAVGASANIQTVKIGDVTGEYVEGVWNLTDNGPIWVSNPYLQTLRWQKDGMAFELLYMGPPEIITRADLVMIAESLNR